MAALNLTFNEKVLIDKSGFMIESDLMVAALSFAAVLPILLPLFTTRYENRFSQRLASELELVRINESRLRTLIENAPDEFYAYDIKGKITNFNDAVCSDLGYSRDELKNTNIFDFKVSLTALIHGANQHPCYGMLNSRCIIQLTLKKDFFLLVLNLTGSLTGRVQMTNL